MLEEPVSVLLILFLVITASIFLSVPASAEEVYYVYVDPLPEWAQYAQNALYETATAYEEVNPGLKFYEASTPEEANIVVKWVKDFGGEHIGQTVYGSFIEVGLGDSNCGNKWNPYSADTVTYIMEHEMGHALGLQHSSDPNDIMYYQIQDLQYGKVEDEVNLAAGYYYLHRLCTVKDVTSYDFSVTTTDPNYGFDVYFVPSEKEVESYRDTGEFSYYIDKGCFGENYLSFSGTCKGVAKESVLLVIMPEKLTEPLETITVQLAEKGSTGIVDISTNKQAYRYEEIIQISGSVKRLEGDDSKLTVTILDPNGRIIDTNTISFAHDNLYAFTIQAKGTFWNKEGTYTVQAQYGSSADIAEQTFEIVNTPSGGIISTTPAIPSISPSYTESYKNTKFHFSIDYPGGWNVDDSDTGNPEDAIVSFADDPEYYRGLLNVFLYENTLEEANLSDKQYFDFLINDIETTCESATIKESGYLCSNFKLMDSKLIEVDGKNAYQARYSWTETDPNGQLWRIISLSTDIPVGNDDWYIYAETLSETYQDYIGVLESSINSFKSTEAKATPPYTQKESTTKPQVPSWVKNTAKWWSEEKINDSDFSTGIEFLIKEKIIKIPETKKSSSQSIQKIPSWVKNNAEWWANGQISEDDFIKGIQYLIEHGIIKI